MIDGFHIGEKDPMQSSLSTCLSINDSANVDICNNDISLTGNNGTFSGIRISGLNNSLIKNNCISVKTGFLRYTYGVQLSSGNFTTRFINNVIDVCYSTVNNDNFGIGLKSVSSADLLIRNNTIRIGYCNEVSAAVGTTYYSSGSPSISLTLENNIFFAMQDNYSEQKERYVLFSKYEDFTIKSFKNNNMFQFNSIEFQ